MNPDRNQKLSQHRGPHPDGGEGKLLQDLDRVGGQPEPEGVQIPVHQRE